MIPDAMVLARESLLAAVVLDLLLFILATGDGGEGGHNMSIFSDSDISAINNTDNLVIVQQY